MKNLFLCSPIILCSFLIINGQTLYVSGGTGTIGNNTTYCNVGIGATTLGNYKLNVWDKIRADEVIVNTTVADNVYKSNFKQLSWSEAEQFIKQNEYLPDIPCFKEMQDNGMNVSEMQTILIQKTEEFTLHAIINKKKLNF